MLLEQRLVTREGRFDPRALALFEGPTLDSVAGEISAPNRIVLFTANLPAEFEDEEELASEIEITLLHEIGSWLAVGRRAGYRLGLE